jgi:hypothetical protein
VPAADEREEHGEQQEYKRDGRAVKEGEGGLCAHLRARKSVHG